MRHHLSLARQLQLILVAFVLMWALPASGANVSPISPWLSLHPTDNIQYLHHLRKQLADDPTNQEAMGLALMAYVNLCLTGEADTDGLAGPWLSYAQSLAERRKALRQGKAWTSIDDAAPELWLQLIQGNRVAVAQALNAWPTATSHRELRVAATGDWRIFKDQPPMTLHERYIAVQIGFEMDARHMMTSLTSTERTHNPAIAGLMHTRANLGNSPSTELIRESVAFTAWLLASSELKDEEAMPLLQRLAEALPLDLANIADRRTRWQRILSACRELDFDYTNIRSTADYVKPAEPLARVLAVSYVICDELAQRPWLRETKRPFDFYTMGDLAAWNRFRIMDASAWGFNSVQGNDYALRDQYIFSVFEKYAPNSLFTARSRVGKQNEYDGYSDKNIKPLYWTSYAQLLEAELDRHHGLSLIELIWPLRRLSLRRRDLATPILLSIYNRWAQPFPRQCFVDLYQTAEFCGETHLILNDLQRLAKQAPLDPPLQEALAEWQPDFRLFDPTKRKPVNSWTDATVNYQKLPTPAMRLRQAFSIIWTGKINIEQPGDYVFAFETDDAAHLVIGDIAVSKPALRGQSIVQITTTLQPGSYDLIFEYEHLRGNALCRLLWATPKEKELSPIPASVLLSEDGKKPGLQARGYNFSRATSARRIFSQRELDFAQTVPWNLKLWDSIADSFYIYDDYAKAAPYYLHITQSNQSLTNGIKYTLCQLKKTPPDAESVITFAKSRPDLWNNFQVADFCDVVLELLNVNRLSDYLAIYRPQHQHIHQMWPYGESLLALSEGRLKDAYVFMNNFLAPDKHGGRYLSPHHFRLLFQHQLVLKRVFEENLDWKALRLQYQRGTPTPWADLVVDWLSGEAHWDLCVARMSEIKDGEQLLYVRAWVDLTTGDHAAAKKGFADMLARHPTWFEAPFCARMVAWYAKQTPDSLEQLPRALPVVPKPGVKVPAKPGANDF
jgi:hypothetical protein